MLYDCFMFNGEVDMLECRFKFFSEADIPCKHVIIESTHTHRGESRKPVFLENQERYRAWRQDIYYSCAKFEPFRDPWQNEHQQRDYALFFLGTYAQPEDVVLIADVDEFPPPGYLKYFTTDPLILARFQGRVSCKQRLMMYAVDWEYPGGHVCSVLARWDVLRRAASLAITRDLRMSLPIIEGGFHLTWLGGVEAQRRKLAVTCHALVPGVAARGDEMTPREAEIISSGQAYQHGVHHSGKLMLDPVEVDETWPGYIYRRECPPNWFRPT
jgi:beta-1,4-mannosyl-glycoprotein beta-1,4-N-acetylglucosaminyltransferase